MNRFIIADPQKCIGCFTCEVACVTAHNGDSPLGLSHENFTPRLRVIKQRDVSTPIVCRQCEDAPCAAVCPNGAIVHGKQHIEVIQANCIGCKTCVIACPYGAIEIVIQQVSVRQGWLAGSKLKSQALKCDLCTGREQGPACVSVCPTASLKLLEPTALEALRQEKQMQTACKEINTQPY